MIVKQVAMRSLGKSDFAGLAKYITDDQNKDHRLGQIRITGCESGHEPDSLSAAIEEILATQLMNKRAKSDKTCHLIVSFRAGECPDTDTLKAIEARICAGLGYAEHQRISAVHNDTDNLHIHIAINKIHPQRLTIHEPYYPHRTLAELSGLLEKEFGLEKDNHEPQRAGAAGRARDMEQHAGVESLLGWIGRECLEDLRKAQSWNDLHQQLDAHGLTLRERGNGLVIVAEDGSTVKASSVGRDFSKGALEKRFGPFQSNSDVIAWVTDGSGHRVALKGPARTSGERTGSKAPAKPKQQYTKKPLKLRVDTSELYARYKAEQLQISDSRSQAMASAKREKDRAVLQARTAARLQRATLKIVDGRALNKKILYGIVSRALKLKLSQIHGDYLQDRAQIYKAHKRCTWADWLQTQALNGCQESLGALRARALAQKLRGNTLGGRVRPESQGASSRENLPPLQVDHITKKGTIVYKANKSAIRDDGVCFAVSQGANLDTIRMALQMAHAKYGPLITVNGTDEFKREVVRVAARCGLSMNFADPALEKTRLALLRQSSGKGSRASGQSSPQPSPRTSPSISLQGEHHERRRPDQPGTGADGFRAGFASGPRSGPGQRPRHPKHKRIHGDLNRGKPSAVRVGGQPPAAVQHRVRALSELGLVQHAQRGEVLLPGDVSHQLEQQERQPNHELRRHVSLRKTPLEAHPKAQRDRSAEQTKISGKQEISRTARYTAANKVLTFRGVQTHDDIPHALLSYMFESGEKRLLIPLDAGSLRLLNDVQHGEKVRLTSTGRIRLEKGRQR